MFIFFGWGLVFRSLERLVIRGCFFIVFFLNLDNLVFLNRIIGVVFLFMFYLGFDCRNGFGEMVEELEVRFIFFVL